jgi:lipase
MGHTTDLNRRAYSKKMKDIKPEILKQNIGDAEVQYLLYPGSGPPLVLLHATGFNPWLWHPVSRSLADNYRVYAPYFCDHRQAEPEEGVAWKLLASDLRAMCEGLALERPYLVGHSMGATIITIAHVTFGLECRGMVLIEPIFLPEELYAIGLTLEQHPLASKSIRRRNSWADESEARAYIESKSLFGTWDREVVDLYVRHGMSEGSDGGLELSCHPRREASLFMGSSHFNPWPLLPDIQCPALVVEGGTSMNRGFIDLPRIASLIPAGNYHEVKGAGHLIPMEQPAEVARIIREFFG